MAAGSGGVAEAGLWGSATFCTENVLWANDPDLCRVRILFGLFGGVGQGVVGGVVARLPTRSVGVLKRFGRIDYLGFVILWGSGGDVDGGRVAVRVRSPFSSGRRTGCP